MGRISRYIAVLVGLTLALAPAAAWAQGDSGDAAGGAIAIALMCCWGIMAILGLVLLVLWLWMLIDCVKRDETQFEGGITKVVWIVLMIFLGGLASIAYYFMVYRKLGKA